MTIILLLTILVSLLIEIYIFFHTASCIQRDETNKVLQTCARLLVHVGRFVPHCRALIVQTGVIHTMLSALGNYKSHSEPSQVNLVTCV